MIKAFDNIRNSLTIVAIAIALSVTASASESPFATGHWVKIKVSDTGIQQITFDQLRQWGFDDPANVHIYGYGGATFWNCFTPSGFPDELPLQYSITSADRILFYGESNFRHFFATRSSTLPGLARQTNNAADAGYYFVSDVQPQSEIAPLAYRYTTNTTCTYHDCMMSWAQPNAIPSGRGQHYYSSNILDMPGSQLSLHFDLPDRSTGSSNRVYVSHLLGAIGTDNTVDLKYPSTDGQSVISSTVNIATSSNKNYSFKNNNAAPNFYTALNEGVDAFDYTIMPAESSTSTWLAAEYVGLYYRRENIFRDTPLTMFVRSAVALQKIDVQNPGATELLAWNIEKPYDVRPYETRSFSNGTLLRFTTQENSYNYTQLGTCLKAIVFDPLAEQYPVEFAGEVTCSQIRSAETPDMLIITTPMLHQQAERLADLHRQHLGHKVLVVDQADIFNEFSSGTPAVNALRRCAKYFYTREASNFKHLLLFGPASSDLRALNGTAATLKSQDNLLLTYPTFDRERQTSVITSFASDAYFGVLSDITSEADFVKASLDINVGRIPANNMSEAINAVDKIENYLYNVPGVDIVNRAMLIADSGDAHSHLNDCEKVTNEISSNDDAITTIKLYKSFYPRETSKAPMLTAAIEQALQTGVGLFDFSGHGKTDSFTAHDIWNISKIRSTEYTIFPLAMLATCDSYTFDELTSCMAQEMVFTPKGGAIGVIGACRTVYLEKNQYLNQLVARFYAQADSKTTTGDIYRQAVNRLAVNNPSFTDLLVNDRCYNLCGDPALPIYSAEKATVGITSVDGNTYAGGNIDMPALKPVTFRGYVGSTDNAATPDKSFNGTIIYTLYDAPSYVKTTDIDNAATETDNVKSILLDENQLVTAKARVVNGEYEITITSPMPMRDFVNDDLKYNRLTMLAISDDNLSRRKGVSRDIVINRDDIDSIDDNEAPTIESIYIDTPSFTDGDITAESITVYAHIAPDESGIRISTGGVGGSTHLSIDNSLNVKILGSSLSINSDGSADIALPVANLTDGPHTATLVISDNAGNTARASVNFTVVTSAGDVYLTVAEHPARVQATISLNHTFSTQPTGRIIIEDHNGNTIVSRDNVNFPYEWDLTDGTQPVADGIYNIYAIFSAGTRYGATPKLPVTVVQKQ